MPNKELLTQEDQALAHMYKADTANGPLSPEEQEAYHALIESQKASHEASLHELKTPEGEQEVHFAESIGDAALNNPMAVHSENWQTERKD